MHLLRKISRIRSALRYGGYNEIKISQIQYPELLMGKKILITGGGSGIGYEIAKKCVNCGAEVVISGRNINKLKNALHGYEQGMHYIQWDITDISSLEIKINETRQLLNGDIDCLVNNAGVQPHKFFPEVDETEWNKIYDTNSKGMFFLTQEICKKWLNQEKDYYRKIINIDSQGGFVGATYPYRMSKWDIRGFTQGLALKMAPHGILVNGIAPGVVKTEMQEFSLKQGENTYCNQNLLQRVQLPLEVAELAVFMLSDACNSMVGQTILIDGGFSLK